MYVAYQTRNRSARLTAGERTEWGKDIQVSERLLIRFDRL